MAQQPPGVSLTIRSEPEPYTPRALSDDELLAVFRDPQADLSLLTDTEQQRLLRLTEAQAATPEAPREGAVSRFISNAAERLNPLTMAQGVYQAVRHPIQTADALVDAQVEQFGKARTALSEGRYSEALGHGAAGVLPVLGPMAAEIGEQIGSGDVAGGLGAAAGVLTPMAAAGPTARAAGRAARPLRQSAERRVVQALGPTKERFKAIAERRAPEILQRGLGGSREALRRQATRERSAAGRQIDELLQQEGSRSVNPQPVIDALEEAKAQFQTTRSVPLGEAIRSGLERAPGARVVGQTVEIPVVYEPRAIAQLNKLQDIVRSLGPEARVEQLVAIRRTWDKVVADAGGYAHRRSGAIGQPLRDISEASIKREATGAIRRLLDDEVPNLSALNREFAFWKDLESVTRQTVQRTAPQGPSLGSTLRTIGGHVIGQSVGATTGYAVGGGIGAAIGAAAVPLVTGQLARLAHAVFTSPRWRLVSARTRARLANALASGDTERISRALGEAAAVTGGGTALTPAIAQETPESTPTALGLRP